MMLRLGLKIDARFVQPYVTPQPQKIRQTATGIYLKYPSLLRGQFSITQPRKKEPAVSAISGNTLTFSHAIGENVFPNLDILDSQLQENARGESRTGNSAPALAREAQRLTTRKQRSENNSQEQEDSPRTASAHPLPVPKPFSKDFYWQKIPLWQDVSEEIFQGYKWQAANVIRDKAKLYRFLMSALPKKINSKPGGLFEHIQTREDFITDVFEGIEMAPMAIRLTPHVLSVIDWANALDDPIRRQFIPMKSSAMPDHPKLTMDSLNEEHDSPVKGLVHRYPDKALFLATSIWPLYCRYCTRSYAVGVDTSTVTKKTLKPSKNRWEDMFKYIEDTPTLNDIVVSGGDSYLLTADQLYEIGKRLISIKHIRRFRFASKGLAVWPSRIVGPMDAWTAALVEVSKLGRKEGKAVALHTHFNHPNEISWITTLAAKRLFTEGVTVRNQSVLLRGVNDDALTMSSLIRGLADINIQPYYVYQGDMVKGVEDLRTPLQTSLDLEKQIRGSIAGFMMPQFVVDLPGGGGKRLAASYLTYDRKVGMSTFVAPAITRGKDKLEKVYEYYDPVWSVEGN